MDLYKIIKSNILKEIKILISIHESGRLFFDEATGDNNKQYISICFHLSSKSLSSYCTINAESLIDYIKK